MSSDSEMPHKKDDMMLTKACLSEVMMPSQTNPSGNVHGGELMKMMDSTAYEAARKYCSANVVTARVDELEFHMPIRIGDLPMLSNTACQLVRIATTTVSGRSCSGSAPMTRLHIS